MVGLDGRRKKRPTNLIMQILTKYPHYKSLVPAALSCRNSGP